MCSEFYTKDEVMTVLNDHNVTHLYHANTVRTACSYLVHKGLFSRQKMEARGYSQTAQSSDRIDVKYGIYNDIFLIVVIFITGHIMPINMALCYLYFPIRSYMKLAI